jgi:hypothetical protein
MTEAEVINAMRRHLEGLFPKVCPTCQRRFATLRAYLLTTEHFGSAIPYDAEMGNWSPWRPLGTVTYAKCGCGHILALTSAGMPLAQLWLLLNWARQETRKRGMTSRELLNYLRVAICKQVLAGPELGDP